MTKEELLKEFLSDDLVINKGYLRKEDVGKIQFSEYSDNILVKVIKTAIISKEDGDNKSITRKLNKLFK